MTVHEREADAWAEQLVRDALPHARTLAQQWTATVSAITALLGASTLLSSDDAVVKLELGWALLYGALAAAALTSAGLAILFGSLAAEARLGDIPADVKGRARL